MSVPTEIMNALYATGMFIGTGAVASLHATVELHKCSPTVTQRTRYSILVFGQLIMVCSVAWLLSLATLPEIIAGIGEFFQGSPTGAVFALLNVMALTAPLSAGLAVWHIRRHPARRATRIDLGLNRA